MEVILPKHAKPLSMAEVYFIAEPFTRAVWPHRYGSASRGAEALAGGIPTSHGCLILWYLNLDWERFISSAEGKMDAYILEELKELIRKGSYVAAQSILHRMTRSKLREVLMSTPGLIKGIEFELPIAIPLPLEAPLEDADLEVYCLAEALTEARRLVISVAKRYPLFIDAELKKWRVPMTSPIEIYEVYEDSSLELEELVQQAVNELLSIVHGGMSRTAYVLILRGEVPGDITLSEFEALLSHELHGLTRLLEPASIFTTLFS